MDSLEFVLWMNNTAEFVGDQPPTPEQWAAMREKISEAVGGVVADRLIELEQEQAKADKRRKDAELMGAFYSGRLIEHLVHKVLKS